LNKKR